MVSGLGRGQKFIKPVPIFYILFLAVDLSDGGSGHFAETVREIKKRSVPLRFSCARVSLACKKLVCYFVYKSLRLFG